MPVGIIDEIWSDVAAPAFPTNTSPPRLASPLGSFYVLTMPGSLPPYDRAIALACTMRTLRGRWLAARCHCGASSTPPIKLMLADRPELARATLADVLVSLRCHKCRARPASVALVETSYGGLEEGGGGPSERGWRLVLHSAG